MVKFIFFIFFMMLPACTTTVGLKYLPQIIPAKVVSTDLAITVGRFVDLRGVESNWIAAAKSAIRISLKTIETDQPVSKLVETAFEDGLRLRGASINSPSPSFQISGAIRRLDCNQIGGWTPHRVNIEANAEIEIAVTEIASGQQRFNRSFTVYNVVDGPEWSFWHGYAASADNLRAVIEKTLSDVVDKALDDPTLRAALQL